MTRDELKQTLDLHGKWLRGEAGGKRADLYGADLIGANLTGANLTGAVGGNSRMQSLQIDPYRIVILDKEIVWGGCTKKTVQEWLDYGDSELDDDDRKYLETVTKPFIRMACGL